MYVGRIVTVMVDIDDQRKQKVFYIFGKTDINIKHNLFRTIKIMLFLYKQVLCS